MGDQPSQAQPSDHSEDQIFPADSWDAFVRVYINPPPRCPVDIQGTERWPVEATDQAGTCLLDDGAIKVWRGRVAFVAAVSAKTTPLYFGSPSRR
jgi:hypothetical protein